MLEAGKSYRLGGVEGPGVLFYPIWWRTQRLLERVLLGAEGLPSVECRPRGRKMFFFAPKQVQVSFCNDFEICLFIS